MREVLVFFFSSVLISDLTYTSYGYVYRTDYSPEQPLILTRLLEDNQNEEAKNASRVVHEDFAGVESYSGYITVNKRFNSNLFFWYFPAEQNFESAPLILWLQGGPGTSSLFGLFCENGPFELKAKDTVSLRQSSWHKEHSVLYIDNPVGTGFSFTDEEGFCTNQTQVGEELYEFMQQFYVIFPELQKKGFIISGEHYAGKYIPALAYTILKKNPTAKLKINVTGLALGGGIVDPIYQNNHSEFAYQVGLVDINKKRSMEKIENDLIAYIKNEQWIEALDESIKKLFIIRSKAGIGSVFNYLYKNDPMKKLKEYYSSYLMRNDVRAALHVGKKPYDSTDVFYFLEADIMKSVAPWLSEVLSNYRVLMYSGQLDFISAYPLTLNFLQHFNYSSADDYKKAERKAWVIDGTLAGYVKEAGNLTEVMVRNAGHLVPYDQPSWAYNLIYKFARNVSLH